MAISQKKVRAFISSTFSDMHAERDHLVTVVFPELRERLDRLGLEFFDVDLRWGVPRTGVDGERANSWAYCKKWISRVEPFFVCMLGERYGWKPPISQIPGRTDRKRYAGLSITEMEIRHAVLERRLRRRSFFYLRTTAVPEGTAPDIYGRFVDRADEEHLDALKARLQQSRRPVRFYDCSWTGERFEDLYAFGDLVLEDLWSGVLRDERYVPSDVWRRVLGRRFRNDPLYSDERQAIPRVIWERLVEAAKPAPLHQLDAEAEQMTTFAASRLRWFHGRQRELRELTQFVRGPQREDDARIAVVRSRPGCGKSALLAKLASQLEDMHCHVIVHFVGATERSADVRSLLDRLVGELARSGVGQLSSEVGKDFENLKRSLADALEEYSGRRKLVLIIDGLNQLSDGHDLAWLPRRPGVSVRVILSCVAEPDAPADSPVSRVLGALSKHRPQPMWVELDALGEDDVRAIVIEYLAEYCHELDREEMDAICAMPQAKNPLYLLVMLHELVKLGGDNIHKKVPLIIAGMHESRPDTGRLFDWFLERLEVFGQEEVRLWCVYLALGRAGMTSRELSDLLKRKLGEGADHTGLLIERGIRKYLQRRGRQWDYSHTQLRDAVLKRYLRGDPKPLHADLATYFEEHWRDPDVHALAELPYHQALGDRCVELSDTLCDFTFIESKCSARMVYDLLRDCDRAVGRHGLAAVAQMRRHLALTLPTLVKRPELSMQAMYNQLRWVEPIEPELEEKLAGARAALDRRGPWISAAGPLPGSQPRGTVAITYETESPLHALSPDGRAVAVVSPGGHVEIRDTAVGDVVDTRELDVERVTAIAFGADASRMVYKDRDGRVYMEQSDDFLLGRPRDRSVSYHPALGVLAVRSDGALVSWDPDMSLQTVLRERLPVPVVTVQADPAGGHVLFVAGEVDTEVGIASRADAGWTVSQWRHPGPPIADARLSGDGKLVLLATRDRALTIAESVSGQVVGHISYEQRRDVIVRGGPCKCAFGIGETAGCVFVATVDGHIACWEWAADRLERLDDDPSRHENTAIFLLETMAPEGQLFVSRPSRGEFVERAGRDLSRVRHAAAVTACCIAGDETAISISQQDQTVRWFSADGLEPLAEQAVKSPTGVAPAQDGNDVFVGTASGNAFLQPRVGRPDPQEVFMAFAEPVVSILCTGPDALVASQSGRVLRIDFAADRVDVLRYARETVKQQKILLGGTAGLFWSLHRDDIAGGTHVVVSLVRTVGAERVILQRRERLSDAAVTHDGETLCLAGRSVEVLKRSGQSWESVYRREKPARAVAFLGNEGLVAVALEEEPWLEVWRVADGLPTVAATHIAANLTCLTTRGDRIAAGCNSGELVSMTIRGCK
jgi:hypothetical protein